MRRFAALTMALALGLASAFLLSACGGGSGTLSSSRASEINQLLDQIQQQADSGDCEGAGALAQRVAQTIEARSDIDSQLRGALVDGLQRIQALSTDPSFCGGASDATNTSTDTTDTDTTDTETTNDADTTPDVVTTPTQTTPTQSTTTTQTSTGSPGGGSGGIGVP